METNVELENDEIMPLLDRDIVMAWKQPFIKHYMNWLHNDAEDNFSNLKEAYIYNLLLHLKQVNVKGHRLYYWNDVDRTKLTDYKWTHCPLSYEKLIDLGPSIAENNRLVSPIYPICFPVI